VVESYAHVDQGRASRLLLELGAAAFALHDVLLCEAPKFEPFWREAVREAYWMAAAPAIRPRSPTWRSPSASGTRRPRSRFSSNRSSSAKVGASHE